MDAALADICESAVEQDFAAPETTLHGDLDTAGNVATVAGTAAEVQAASLALRAAARYPGEAGAYALNPFPRVGEVSSATRAGWQHFHGTNSLMLGYAGRFFGVIGVGGDLLAGQESFSVGDNHQGALDVASAVAGVASFASLHYGLAMWAGTKVVTPMMKSRAKLECRGIMSSGPALRF